VSRKLRVLIVDDNTDLIETLKDILELKGFEAVGAEGGWEAYTLAGHQKFDVVLLDLVMPGMNGVETLRAIRKLAPTTKFIVVTAYAASDQADEAREEGVLEVFSKPASIEQIVKLVSAIKPAEE
jgi:DNA-binding NtrC family response regulator